MQFLPQCGGTYNCPSRSFPVIHWHVGGTLKQPTTNQQPTNNKQQFRIGLPVLERTHHDLLTHRILPPPPPPNNPPLPPPPPLPHRVLLVFCASVVVEMGLGAAPFLLACCRLRIMSQRRPRVAVKIMRKRVIKRVLRERERKEKESKKEIDR